MKLLLLSFPLLAFSFMCVAQNNVGIGTNTPDVSAKLDISSSNAGLLIPRTGTSGLVSYGSPAKGLMVLDTTLNQLMVNMGTAAVPNWQNIVFKSGWGLSGNSGTNPLNNFIGTLDNTPINFKQNNKWLGRLNAVNGNYSLGAGSGEHSTGTSNTAFGDSAAALNTTGGNNVAIGSKALLTFTLGDENTAVGSGALLNSSGSDANTAIGYRSMAGTGSFYFNTTVGAYSQEFASGTYNTSLGDYALRVNTGNDNIAIGSEAMFNTTTGSDNSSLGDFGLHENITGGYNIAVGHGALYHNFESYNLAIGPRSAYANTSGAYNIAIGYNAYSGTTNSQGNTVVGYSAGDNFNMGYYNTIIGANCDVNAAGVFNSIAIGQSVVATASSQARIGNASTNSIGGYANWSNFSDGRFKKDVNENVAGLAFIMKLKPVTYHLDVTGLSNKLGEFKGREKDKYSLQAIAEKEKILYTGFIAQDVEKAAKQLGYDFSGVDKPKNDNDMYGLRYADFVAPLVKGMQEQQQMIEYLKNNNADLQKQIDELKALIKK